MTTTVTVFGCNHPTLETAIEIFDGSRAGEPSKTMVVEAEMDETVHVTETRSIQIFERKKEGV